MKLVYGLGISGIAAAKLLLELGHEVALYFDGEGEIPQCLGSVFDRRKLPAEAILHSVDLIVISPSVPLDAPVLQAAEKAGIEIIPEIELAARHCPSKIISVCGTNGKTSTAMLITHIFSLCDRRALSLGNIGVPFCRKARTLSAADFVILETSSFQSEGLKNFKPNAAVLLNITPDHFERHKNMEGYVRAKGKIFAKMQEDGFAILNYDDSLAVNAAKNCAADKYYFSLKSRVRGLYSDGEYIYNDIAGRRPVRLCRAGELNQTGAHNIANALAAGTAAMLFGLEPKAVISAIKTFSPPAHRIEKIGKIGKTTFYNDSKATNPDATVKAAEAMTGATALILGGFDKGLCYTDFFKRLPQNTAHIVAYGANKQKLQADLPQEVDFSFELAHSLEDAVELAASKNALNVLFSPATSSFDMFRDYKERGDAFVDIVKNKISGK